MRPAVIVARELLRCRLLESGRDAMLERVAELLDAACRGASPFCITPMSQVVVGGTPIPDTTARPLPGPLKNLSVPTSPEEQPEPLRTCHLSAVLLRATSPGATLVHRPLVDRTRGRLKKVGM